MSKNLTSITLERRALGGLIKYPYIYADIASFSHHEDFCQPVNEHIFILACQRATKNEKVESTLIAQDLRNLGLTTKDDVDIFEYIDSLTFTQITPEGAKEAFKQLSTLRIKRDLAENLKNALDAVINSADKPLDEVLAVTDNLYNNEIKRALDVDNSIDVFENLEKMVMERAKNPVEDIGFLTPFPAFNNLNGGLRPKNLYAVVARPGEGKSNWLTEMSFGTSLVNDFKIKVLYLDTENEEKDMQYRMLSSISGVPFWYLETGNWINHKEYKEKTEKAFKLIRDRKYSFNIYKVGNKSIEQVCSYARRWHLKNVGRGNSSIIVYDYVKLTTEKVDKNWAEHQIVGDKVDKLKKLAEELNSVILVAAQVNKTGESSGRKSGDIVDDSSIIALSDKLQWYATYTAHLRPKTIDELEMDGLEYGTHKLIKFKGRFQGKEAKGHSDIIHRKINGKIYVMKNYINYDINNFKIEEKGTLQDILSQQKIKRKNQPTTEPTEELL